VAKHSDQTKRGHNIRFATKWWKNSWFIIVVGGFVAIFSIMALIILVFGIGGIKQEEATDGSEYAITSEEFFAETADAVQSNDFGEISDLQDLAPAKVAEAEVATTSLEKVNLYIEAADLYLAASNVPDAQAAATKAREELANVEESEAKTVLEEDLDDLDGTIEAFAVFRGL